jgi:peptide/nickel transport system ATP-binding protein
VSTVLELDDVEVKIDSRPVVSGVSIAIASGKSLAVVGRSGVGKTTLARAVMGVLPSDVQLSGQVKVDGVDVTRLAEPDLRTMRGSTVSMLPQDATATMDPLWRVHSLMLETIRAHHGITRSTSRLRTAEMLELVGFADPPTVANKRIYELSGGMKRRVALALALVNEPKVLIIDEPTASLDAVARDDMIDLINQTRAMREMSLLVISHDHRVARQLGDSVVELTPTGVQAPEVEVRTYPIVAPAPDVQERSILLRVNEVTKSFKGSMALDGFSLTVGRSELLGIVGESGSGKSTFARLLTNLIKPSKGSIELEGTSYRSMSRSQRKEFRSKVQLVLQDPFTALDERLSVGDIVAEPLRAQRRWADTGWDAVSAALGRVGLDETYLDREPTSLSGGQRQRVNIARAIVVEPEVLILDEPTSSLDPESARSIVSLLRELHERLSMTCVVISHDLPLVASLVERVVVVRAGKVVEEGGTAHVIAEPTEAYTRKLLIANGLASD